MSFTKALQNPEFKERRQGDLLKNAQIGVPTVAQWVKELALSLWWHEFDPCPGNFNMSQVQPLKKKSHRSEEYIA